MKKRWPKFKWHQYRIAEGQGFLAERLLSRILLSDGVFTERHCTVYYGGIARPTLQLFPPKEYYKND